MSHKHNPAEGYADCHGEGEHAADDPGPPRHRQPNGTGPDPAGRRSWRPCQTPNQDGEPVHHHHHHNPHHPPHQQRPASASARGPPRQRRRTPQGQGQAPGEGRKEGVEPQPEAEPEAEPQPAPHPRPGVARYRRMGDPNPRLRAHRPRQPGGEATDTPTQRSPGNTDRRSQGGEGPDPTTALPAQAGSDHPPLREHALPRQRLHSPAADEDVGRGANKQQRGKEEEDEEEEEEEAEKDRPEASDGDGLSGYVHDDTRAFEDWREDQCGRRALEGEGEEEREEEEEEDERVRRGGGGGGADSFARESEANDLCSDTESAASLSMEGHLHSPPPLHSPTPPSSPEVSSFPHLDQYHEDAGPSPDTPPDREPPPGDDEDEDSLAPRSVSYAYPKTYADFYSESHSKSTPQPLSESHPEAYTKSYPDSFPEPLMTPYPELGREPYRRSGRRCESWEEEEDEEDSYREPSPKHRSHENVEKEKGTLASPAGQGNPGARLSRDLSSFQTQTCQSRSVGSRLHHYDGQSDGEGDSTDGSISSKSQAAEPRQAPGDAQERRRVVPGQGRPGDTRPADEPAAGATGDDAGRGTPSGDAISLAIKDIREAIEEVKTKTVRSPYTPDQPVEPIWVMRQDVSPTDDGYQPTAGPGCHGGSLHHGAPAAPAQPREREGPRPTQPYAQPQVYPAPKLLGFGKLASKMRRSLHSFPTFVEVPGPCDPEDLIDGIIFAASYLGSTHLLSERTPSKSARMQQAQEAMHRVRAAQKQAKNRKKSAEAQAPSTAEVDLFMSTQRIKVLNADTQEAMMDLPLRTISYIADIGNMVVLMARGRMVRPRSATQTAAETAAEAADEGEDAEHETLSGDDRRLYRMICHVFESEDAQLIAQSIGQSFSVAYQEFLRANGIDPEDLSQREYSDLLNTQDMYNDDLIHFSKSENCKDVYIEKQKGEMLGLVIVESGWGSILPTVIIASMMHAGPAERSGRLNIGDQIMTINGTSLVGLPLNTCQSIIKGLKSQSRIKMNIVRCPPVTMVLIRRPDLRYQLGFSVQNGIIHMKTMPAAMYRLLTAQEQPVYI
ncbi:hypothetical protein NHX12_027535 [Muraenolepis orangiensis]|uniref:Uncharacterized protein n=1 Tax=Muraenolepis orangiensis TaxID=630683 RepID=A0A9Q0EEY9_9TELE|nr:hypothetical protein NHX12_027535 [Muraenolepis orangiensis]